MKGPSISYRKQKYAVLSVNATFISHTLPVTLASSTLKQVSWVTVFPGPIWEGVSGRGCPAGGRQSARGLVLAGQSSPQHWHGGPGGATDPAGSWRAGWQNKTKKDTFLGGSANSPCWLCGCMVVGTGTEWPRSVCVSVWALCLCAGHRKGGAGGDQEQGDYSSQFKWTKLHSGLGDSMRWFELYLRGTWVVIRNISSWH